jgi:hypothetical protein
MPSLYWVVRGGMAVATTSPGDLEGIDRIPLSGATKLSLFGDTMEATMHTGYTVLYGTVR